MKLHDNEIVITDEVSGRQIIVNNDDWIASGQDIDSYFGNMVGPNSLNAIRNRASVDEIISFANKIREAGNADLIDGLLPSVPEDANSCLIANALNFDCAVNSHSGDWCMEIADAEVGVEIAEKLGLDYNAPSYLDYVDDDGEEHWEYEGDCDIYLPEEIGLVAAAFDTYRDYELEEFNTSRFDN
jgi:hypothetical protein